MESKKSLNNVLLNSAISTQEKFKRIIDFRLGETLFFFVSPERFIMEDFRNVIKNIDGSNFGLGFSLGCEILKGCNSTN